MTDALIIDACRTPRGIGKQGKGALADMHPQHLAATVLKALAERNAINTAEVDDIIWGTSTQKGPQGNDMGRMAALDAGYDAPSVDAVNVVHGDDPTRDYPEFAGRPSIPFFDYHGTVPNSNAARFRAGPWIDVRAGMDYPMEVIIGETPGGGFFALLGIEVSTGRRENGQFQGERKVRLFKIGNGELPPEIAGGAGTGWEMNPGDWTFQPPGGGAKVAR